MVLRRLSGIALLFLATAVATAEPSLGQANDEWATRRQILALPFTIDEFDADLATASPSDPIPPCRSGSNNPLENTLWYGYTAGATTEYLTLSIPGGTVGKIAVFEGTPGAFRIVTGGCAGSGDFPGQLPRIVGLQVPAGGSISIMIGTHFSLSTQQSMQFSVSASVVHQVTKPADTADGSCDGDCSLREAIDASNGNPGVVLVPAGAYVLTRAGTSENQNGSGDLDLTAAMAIRGAGAFDTTIDAAMIDRVLDIAPSQSCCRTFIVGDLRMINGAAPTAAGSEARGGGIRVGSGNAYVGFERLLASGHAAQEQGGAIYLASPGVLRASEIVSNDAGHSGGGVALLASPEFALQVDSTTFFNNAATLGGGLHVQGSIDIVHSTIASNHASLVGGGINFDSSGGFTLFGSTVVDNSAGDNPFASQTGAGLRLAGTTPHRIGNSVIARNRVANPGDAPDCALAEGTLLSSFNHVQAPGSCAFAGAGDVSGSDPLLAMLPARNGGLPRTYALLTGSAALDSANPAGCVDAYGAVLLNDQRGAGFARTIGPSCDKGALESPLLTPPGVPSLDAASDSGDADDDDLTNVALPALSGSCVDGTTIRLYDPGALLPTQTCVGGSYAITVTTPLDEGLRFVVATADNGVVTSLASDPLLVTVDLTAPAPPSILSPTLSVPYAITVSGSAVEPLGTVSVHEGPTALCSAAVNAQSMWSCGLTLVGVGAHDLTARHLDVAGNLGTASAPFTVVISNLLLTDGFEGQ